MRCAELGDCGSPPLRRGAALLRSPCIPEVARPLPPRHVCLLRVKGSLARFPVAPARVPRSACPRPAPEVFRASVSPHSRSRSRPPEFSLQASHRASSQAGFSVSPLFCVPPTFRSHLSPHPNPPAHVQSDTWNRSSPRAAFSPLCNAGIASDKLVSPSPSPAQDSRM